MSRLNIFSIKQKMPKNYDLCLVATHVNDVNIHNLVTSVLSNNKQIDIFFIIISQGNPSDFKSTNPLVDIQSISVQNCSLSKARNIGISLLKKSQNIVNHIMFPDDDTTFDATFFENYQSIVRDGVSYIIPIYQRDTLKELYMGYICEEGARVTPKMDSLIGSPNQIIAYPGNEELVYFNEDLGVGAKYGSCEDLDLFIRLDRNGSNYYYTSAIHNFHPGKTQVFKSLSLERLKSRFKNYSAGFCFIIFKYQRYSAIPAYLIRPLGASLIYLFKLNIRFFRAYLYQFFIRIYLLISFNFRRV